MSSKDSLTDYLRRSIASSQRVERKLAKVVAESKSQGTDQSAQDQTIRLNFEEDNRDIPAELENLFLGFFEPAVARRLMQSSELTESMQQYLVDFWGSDIAPGLTAYRGKTRNVSTILAFLKRQYNRAENVTREAEAFQAGDGTQNNLWKTGRAIFSQEEKGVYTELVLGAKALHNSERVAEAQFASGDKEAMANSILQLFEIDRTMTLLVPHLRPSFAKTLASGKYAQDVSGVKAALRRELLTAKQNTLAHLSLFFKAYQDDVTTYDMQLRHNAWHSFDLAREIFKHEKARLTDTLNQLIQQRAPVLSDGSQVTFVDGKRVPRPAAGANAASGSASGSANAAHSSGSARAPSANASYSTPPRSSPAKSAWDYDPNVISPLFRQARARDGDDGEDMDLPPYKRSRVQPTPRSRAREDVEGEDWGSPAHKRPRVPPARDEEIEDLMYGSGVGKQKAARRGEHILNDKYYIQIDKLLKQGVLDIRYIKNRHLVPIRMQAVSPLFRDLVMARIQGDANVDKAKFSELTNTEQHLFRAVCKYLDIDGGALPDNSDQLSDRLQVLFGALRAGHNSPEVKREAYLLLHHSYLMHKIGSAEFHALARAYDL